MDTRKGLWIAENNPRASGPIGVWSPGPELEIYEWLHSRKSRRGRNTTYPTPATFAFHSLWLPFSTKNLQGLTVPVGLRRKRQQPQKNDCIQQVLLNAYHFQKRKRVVP